MPNTTSAKKRLRQNVGRRARNRAAKSMIRTHVKQVREAIAAGKTAEADAALKVAVKRIDQTAAKGIIHRNAAARTKSRLSAALKAAKSKAS
jgi:small subunit ribosomal protein S20